MIKTSNKSTIILICSRTSLLSHITANENRFRTDFKYGDATNNTTDLINNGSKVRQYNFTIRLQHSGDTKIQ